MSVSQPNVKSLFSKADVFGRMDPFPQKPNMNASKYSSIRVWLWVLLLVPVAAVGTGSFLLGLGFVFNASGTSVPLTADERNLLLDIEHTALYLPDFEPTALRADITKTVFLDDSYELNYVYDDPENAAAPYLAYTVTFEGSAVDAKTTYASSWGGTQAALFLGGGDVSVEEQNDLFSWGERSRFAVLTSDGRPFGNVFVGRNGTRVVYFLLAGLYFDEPAAIRQLLETHLKRLEAY